MSIVYDDNGITVHHGDCLDVLPALADASVDAVVTDPPYGLEFMGKTWDSFKAAPEKGRADLTDHSNFTPKKSVFKDGVGTQLGMPKKNPRCRVCFRLKFDKAASKCACEAPDWDTRTREYAQDFGAWCQLWATECLRVLKPGGHLLAFGGTRTSHRLTSAIEDAGFEIRDSIAWLYGSGFAKSWNFKTQFTGAWCGCNPLPYNHASDADLSRVRGDILSPTVARGEGQDAVLLASVQRGSAGSRVGEARAQGPSGVVAGDGGQLPGEDSRGGQSLLAGRIVHRRQGLPQSEGTGPSERATERLRSGTRPSDGVADWSPGSATRGGPSHQPEPGGQPTGESEAVPGPYESLDDRALRDGPVCPRCGGLDPIYRGFGTGIKPSHEPIVVARKPLAGTVAQTVLAWGTGALNVEACRVGAPEDKRAAGTRLYVSHGKEPGAGGGEVQAAPHDGLGRWPANIVLSHSATCTDTACVDGCPVREVDAQSGELTSGGRIWTAGDPDTDSWRSLEGRTGPATRGNYARAGDFGGASRFYYTAKADANERVRVPKPGAGEGRVTGLDGKIRRCRQCGSQAAPLDSRCGHDDYEWVPSPTRSEHVAHPTVKPLALMRWLVRLVTPPGGLILDPFAGSGTTLEAALLEGFACIGVEREAEYLPLIVQRLNRRRDPVAYVKAAGGDGGLFDLLDDRDPAAVLAQWEPGEVCEVVGCDAPPVDLSFVRDDGTWRRACVVHVERIAHDTAVWEPS